MPEATDSKRRTFWRRTASTLGLWGVVAAAFASGWAWAYVSLIGLLGLLATIEYFQMLKAAGVKSFPRYGILLAAAYSVSLYWSLLSGTATPTQAGGIELARGIDAVAIFAALAGAFFLQLRYPIRGLEGLQAVSANLLGFVYLAFLFNFTARLVFLVPPERVPGDSEVPGAMVLLWLLAVTKFTDMGAYLVGSAIGKHKMIPHLSPGKTWQGFGGALVFAQLAGCVLFALMPNQLAVLGGWGHVVVLGVVIALVAVVGDLAESVVKRSLAAKDSGHMLPGIGGALDLIDSICFTAPVLYFYLKWVTMA